jgi:hypothetical protein
MKFLVLTFSLACFSLNALADSYAHCGLKGISDTDIKAPSHVSLSEARDWSLTVDKKKIASFSLKEEKTLIVSYKKNNIEFQFDIDDSQCEDVGFGSASLLMTSSGYKSIAVYICECAID